MNRLYTLLAASVLTSTSALAQSTSSSSTTTTTTTTKTTTIAPTAGSVQKDGEEIFTYVEQMPEATFDLGEYFSKTLVYPKDAQAKNIEGRVMVKFVVDEKGKVMDATIAKSVYPSIDSTALSIVRKMPKWKPGYSNGKPVKVYYTLPIRFRLEDPEPVKKN